MEYALDQAVAWNAQPKSMFFGRLDMERVGVLGHSAGANAIAVLCSKVKRVKAGLVLDPGSYFPKDATGFPFWNSMRKTPITPADTPTIRTSRQ